MSATPRPGLPMPAARYAAQRGETLTYSEALLDARADAPEPGDDELLDAAVMSFLPRHLVADLAAELARLRSAAADRIVLLERLAYEEAQRYDMDLKYPLCRLDEDCYVPWSGSADRPVGPGLLTREQALARGWTSGHLARADDRAAEDGEVLWNRAGPGETCLTRAALKEAYADDAAYREFRLTPEKIQPGTTSGRLDPETGEWDHHTVYWTPWAPDEVPSVLPKGWPDRL